MTTMLVTTSGIRMYVAAWSMPTICCLSGPASFVPIEFWPIWENPKPSAEGGEAKGGSVSGTGRVSVTVLGRHSVSAYHASYIY